MNSSSRPAGNRFFYHHWERSQWLLALILLLTCTLAACSSGNGRRESTAAEPTPLPTAVPVNKQTYQVELGDIVYTQNFPGRVTPALQSPLYFAQSGQVSEVLVERDQNVEAGELIARLDTTALENELAVTQSELAIAQQRLDSVQKANEVQRQRAELNLALAQLDLDFAINQAGEAPTAQQQYQIQRLTLLRDLAQIAVNELEDDVDLQLSADVQQLQLHVSELESAIANAVLLAPFSGAITALNLRPGQAITPADQVGTLADFASVEVTANLQPNRLEELSEGMLVTMTPANRPGAEITGVIQQLPAPYGTGDDINMEGGDTLVHIVFDEVDADALALGDRVTISTIIAEHPNVLWLPPAAIRDFNGRKFVIVEDAQGQSRVDVVLGLEGNGRVEILEGLLEGQTIVGQ